jgi:hypothetical protein
MGRWWTILQALAVLPTACSQKGGTQFHWSTSKKWKQSSFVPSQQLGDMSPGFIIRTQDSNCGPRFRNTDPGFKLRSQVSKCGPRFQNTDPGFKIRTQDSNYGPRFRNTDPGFKLRSQVSKCGPRFQNVDPGFKVRTQDPFSRSVCSWSRLPAPPKMCYSFLVPLFRAIYFGRLFVIVFNPKVLQYLLVSSGKGKMPSPKIPSSTYVWNKLHSSFSKSK